MNLNETINNILPSELKAKLKSAFMQFAETPMVAEVAKEQEPIKMAEIKLVDGNVVSVEGELVVGAKIFLVTPEGLVVAPNGEHTAEDGTVTTVMDGVITEVASKEEETPEMPEQMSEINKLKTEMASMLAELNSLKAEFAKQNETSKLTLSAINKIIETPVAEPVEMKVDFSTLTAYQKHKLAKYGKI